MSNVNWWLMALAFLLGLVLTWIYLIRRVTREVPRVVAASDDLSLSVGAAAAGVGATAAGGLATSRPDTPDVDAPEGHADLSAPDVEVPDVDVPEVDVPDADPELDSPTIARSSLEADALEADLPETDVPTVDAAVASPEVDADESARLPVAAFVAGPYPGSAAPNEDRSQPDGFDIKGNEDSMLFHTTASPYYGRTIAEVWFQDEASAEAAGFTRWDNRDS